MKGKKRKSVDDLDEIHSTSSGFQKSSSSSEGNGSYGNQPSYVSSETEGSKMLTIERESSCSSTLSFENEKRTPEEVCTQLREIELLLVLLN